MEFMILRKIFSKDITSLILRKIFSFKFETFWLRNERCNMLKEYSKKNYYLFIRITEVTRADHIGCIQSFLHQYRHEAGRFYTDTYDCSFYLVKGNKVCDCGECGGVTDAIWCEYKFNDMEWQIDHQMDSVGKITALEISNLYFADSIRYQQRMEEKRNLLRGRVPKLYKFR